MDARTRAVAAARVASDPDAEGFAFDLIHEAWLLAGGEVNDDGWVSETVIKAVRGAVHDERVRRAIGGEFERWTP